MRPNDRKGRYILWCFFEKSAKLLIMNNNWKNIRFFLVYYPKKNSFFAFKGHVTSISALLTATGQRSGSRWDLDVWGTNCQ